MGFLFVLAEMYVSYIPYEWIPAVDLQEDVEYLHSNDWGTRVSFPSTETSESILVKRMNPQRGMPGTQQCSYSVRAAMAELV